MASESLNSFDAMSSGPAPAVVFEPLSYDKWKLRTAEKTTYRVFAEDGSHEDIEAETVNEAMAQFSKGAPAKIERLGIAVSNVLSGDVLIEVPDEEPEQEAPTPAEAKAEEGDATPEEAAETPAEESAETELAETAPAEQEAAADAPVDEPAPEAPAEEDAAKTVDNPEEAQ